MVYVLILSPILAIVRQKLTQTVTAHVKDNLPFDSCAKVSKLEKQLDDMIRTSSIQDETLLPMEQELTQRSGN